MSKTKIHSFKSKPLMHNGILGHFWEQMSGGKVIRGFVSESANAVGMRDVCVDVEVIPDGVRMIDDNIFWEDTYTAKVLNGTYRE